LYYSNDDPYLHSDYHIRVMNEAKQVMKKNVVPVLTLMQNNEIKIEGGVNGNDMSYFITFKILRFNYNDLIAHVNSNKGMDLYPNFLSTLCESLWRFKERDLEILNFLYESQYNFDSEAMHLLKEFKALKGKQEKELREPVSVNDNVTTAPRIVSLYRQRKKYKWMKEAFPPRCQKAPVSSKSKLYVWKMSIITRFLKIMLYNIMKKKNNVESIAFYEDIWKELITNELYIKLFGINIKKGRNKKEKEEKTKEKKTEKDDKRDKEKEEKTKKTEKR